MILHAITVYHNTSNRFTTYTAGDTLREVISHYRELPEITKPKHVAEWIFDVLNADMESLERARANAGGESGFLLACAYRLLGLRSLSVGDVVAIAVVERTTWLSCDSTGWRRIPAPQRPVGRRLPSAIGHALRTRAASARHASMIEVADPHVVLTGNPVDGFGVFGPTPMDDEDGRSEARTRQLEKIGKGWWLAPLRPLEELETIDGVDDTRVDIEVPGTGTVHAGDAYLTIVANGRPVSAFALAGTELIEAVDWLSTGRPDWANGAVCDLAHGDTGFIQAAVTLLRSQNPHLQSKHVWPQHLHDEVQRALRVCARRGLIADWDRAPACDGYDISLPDARTLALRTPQQALAFLSVLSMMFGSATVLRDALPGPAAIRRIAADIVGLIRADVTDGVVPRSLESTAELARYRDLPSYCAALDPAYDISAAPFSTVSAICAQIDASIAQGRLLTDDGSPMPART